MRNADGSITWTRNEAAEYAAAAGADAFRRGLGPERAQNEQFMDAVLFSEIDTGVL